MGPFIVLLIAAGILALWVVAAVKLFRFGAPGVRYFFLALLIMLIIDALAFVFIVVPSLDCTGFLCGLEEIFIFMAICALLLLIFPLILLTKGLSSLRKNQKIINDELLDSEPGEK